MGADPTPTACENIFVCENESELPPKLLLFLKNFKCYRPTAYFLNCSYIIDQLSLFKCIFSFKLKNQFILLFNLFLFLFIGLIIFFNTIYESLCIILVKFYLYLSYFQQKNFNFNKISGSQTDPNLNIRVKKKFNFEFFIVSFLHF